MNGAPFFTVGIPTYNRAKWLGEAIELVLRQSFSDFELLVSDNASTDDTAGVAASFADVRIRYVRQAENIGPAANFNYVIEHARGEFLVFNQDDDRERSMHPRPAPGCRQQLSLGKRPRRRPRLLPRLLPRRS